MSDFVDFKKMGWDNDSSEFLNWCLKYRNNLESQIKKNEVMEIWEEKNVEGTASLSFNNKGVLLRVSKNLFS